MEEKIQDSRFKIQNYRKNIVLLFLFIACHLILATSLYAQDVKSRSALVMDAATGRLLYAKNPALRLMPASTTKLMTGLIVVEKANLSDMVTISKHAAGIAPTRTGLKAGDKVTVETLLYAALLKSANDAAVALAEAVAGSEEEFVKMMNMKALAIGANDTRFINPNGLPGEGQYITAYDLAKIMRQAIKYPVLKHILGTRVAEISTETGKTLFIKNTNRLLWSDEEILGGKTGYTRQARHCLVSAGERENDTIIVALLGTPSRDLLWKETEELLGFGSRVLNNLEEPVIYFSKSDYDAEKLTKVSYTKKTKYSSKKKGQTKKHKKISSKKKPSANKKVVSAKKKSMTRVNAKKGKTQPMAQKGGHGTEG